MRIKSIFINRFRGYADPIKAEFSNLSVLVGKNDIGKSAILEALDIFFNDGRGCVKLDKEDINKKCLSKEETCIEIAVEFDDLPQSIIIDSTNETSLMNEYLLSASGTLHVIKKYKDAGKEKVFIKANHPTAVGCKDLLLKKNSELKTILEEHSLECLDKTKNAELRKAIWKNQADLELQEIEIEVAKIDENNIWNQLKSYMPLYTLFQSDRKNSDGDNEVQDPMRLAVKEILNDTKIQSDLEKIACIVKNQLKEVASRTLEKLSKINPDIASSLTPKIPESKDLKWSDVFKSVSIAGDNEVPVNKRGSGVKRLMLISFFQAEAERRQKESNLHNVVYAIEEPETSQHPAYQRTLIDSLITLSKETSNSQIMLTTHSPYIVKQLEFDNILLITEQESKRIYKTEKKNLPYPSLNEINYVAFCELSFEYHNELYGFIEENKKLGEYKKGKPVREYKKKNGNDDVLLESITLTEYIRHQIHHPENKNNQRFTDDELKESIELMRSFIQKNK